MNHVLLILLGGPVLMGAPPALAIWLCERHANQSAAAIREAFGTAEQSTPTADRTKELAR